MQEGVAEGGEAAQALGVGAVGVHPAGGSFAGAHRLDRVGHRHAQRRRLKQAPVSRRDEFAGRCAVARLIGAPLADPRLGA